MMLDVRKFRARRLVYRACGGCAVVLVVILSTFGSPLRKARSRRSANLRNLAVCEGFLDASLGVERGPSLAAFADTSVFVNCVARVAGMSRYLELGASKNATYSRVHVRHKAVGVGDWSLTKAEISPQQHREAVHSPIPKKLPESLPSSFFYDIIVLDSAARDDATDLGDLRAAVDDALAALSPAGVLLIPRAAPDHDDGTAAWRVTVLLRARYDLDVRVSDDWATGVAVVRKRPTTSPMPLEDLPNSAIAALEWHPRGAASMDSPELVFYELFDTPQRRAKVLALLPFGQLLEWTLDLTQPARTLFGKRVDARADNARWRRTCAAQLEARDSGAAFSCFKGVLRASDSPQMNNPATLVPHALLLASRGDADGAANLLRAAIEANPELATYVMTEAATTAALS